MLKDSSTDSAAPGYALMVQLSADLGEVLAVLHFPEGTVDELGRVRDTALRGAPTGLLTVSGRRTVPSWERDGYLIARLDGNFVDGLPTGLSWLVDVSAKPRNAGSSSCGNESASGRIGFGFIKGLGGLLITHGLTPGMACAALRFRPGLALG